MNRIVHPLRAAALAATLVCTLPWLSGCSSRSTYQSPSNTTLGRELQDLQESYDKGIITEKQYEDTKKRLIKKHTD